MATRNRTPGTYRKWRQDKLIKPQLTYVDYQILKTLQNNRGPMKRWDIYIDLVGRDRHESTIRFFLGRLLLHELVHKPRYGWWALTDAGHRACAYWERRQKSEQRTLTTLASLFQDVPP